MIEEFGDLFCYNEFKIIAYSFLADNVPDGWIGFAGIAGVGFCNFFTSVLVNIHAIGRAIYLVNISCVLLLSFCFFYFLHFLTCIASSDLLSFRGS